MVFPFVVSALANARASPAIGMISVGPRDDLLTRQAWLWFDPRLPVLAFLLQVTKIAPVFHRTPFAVDTPYARTR